MKTLRSIIRLCCLISVVMAALPLLAQEERKITKYVPDEAELEQIREKTETGPLFQGVTASADVYGLVGKLFGNHYTSAEFALEVNLKNRFFPIVEFGYGKCEYTDDDLNIYYKTGGPFFRVGMNYNFLYKKKQSSYIYGGVRYAYAPFNYDVAAPELHDPVWGGNVPFSFSGVKGNMAWAELVFGLQAKICSIVHMGWTVRYKCRLTEPDALSSNPWYVPGFGTYGSSTFGATYNIIIDLPFGKSSRKKPAVTEQK